MSRIGTMQMVFSLMVCRFGQTKLFPEEFLSASDLEPETQVDPFGIQGNPNRRTALVDDEDSDDDEDDDSDDDNDDDSDDEDSE